MAEERLMEYRGVKVGDILDSYGNKTTEHILKLRKRIDDTMPDYAVCPNCGKQMWVVQFRSARVCFKYWKCACSDIDLPEAVEDKS